MQESKYSPVQITPDPENCHNRRPHEWARGRDLEDLSWSPHQVFVVLPFLLRPATFDLVAHKHAVHGKGEIPGWLVQIMGAHMWGSGFKAQSWQLCPWRKQRKHEYATPLIAFPEIALLAFKWIKMIKKKKIHSYIQSTLPKSNLLGLKE